MKDKNTKISQNINTMRMMYKYTVTAYVQKKHKNHISKHERQEYKNYLRSITQ